MARRGAAGERGLGALLERERELVEMRELLGRAGSGSGSLLVLEGPAGIGKTSLVRAARALARERGFGVLSARGSDLEREVASGVVRQLLEPRLAAAPAGERAALLQGAAGLAALTLRVDGSRSQPERTGGAPADHRSFPALHGLYGLCANLAGLGPLLLSVDDAHWSDAPSLRFLAYLSRRLEAHPILLLVAVRPAEVGADTPALCEVLADPLARVLKLAPLSPAAVRALVRRSLSGDAAEDFCRACHAATAGNPLFLRELIAALRAAGIAPTAAAAERVEELGSEAVPRAVLLRLVRLPSAAIELARAVAILGDDADLRQAAALARIDGGAASEAEAALRRAGLFEAGGALRFAQPIVRAALCDDPPLAKRSRAPAARTLLEDPGLAVFAAATALHCARIDLLAGDLATAEEELRRAYEALASGGEAYLLPPLAALLAQAVAGQGRLDEAEAIRQAAEELGASDDGGLQALWPSVRGEGLAWRERAAQAERRAREAVDLIRIRAALSRLITAYSEDARGDRDRSASDRRAWHLGGRAVAAAGLTRERFLRDILANETLPDGYARAVALETLDIAEELFASMMALSRNAELAQAVAGGPITEAAAARLAELLGGARRDGDRGDSLRGDRPDRMS